MVDIFPHSWKLTKFITLSNNSNIYQFPYVLEIQTTPPPYALQNEYNFLRKMKIKTYQLNERKLACTFFTRYLLVMVMMMMMTKVVCALFNCYVYCIKASHSASLIFSLLWESEQNFGGIFNSSSL